jgi:hypothetical protein
MLPLLKSRLQLRRDEEVDVATYVVRRVTLLVHAQMVPYPNPIIIDDDYSLRKDKVGNVFAKYVGTQSGVKKRTIWVAKPIVTNLLGPNLVGDQQAKT